MEIKTVTLARVHVSGAGKDGKPFITKTGKPYKRIGILVDDKEDRDFRDVWLSNMAFRDDDPCLSWKEGMRVQIAIEKNGQYVNFKVPTGMDMLTIRVEELELKVKALMGGPANVPGDSPEEAPMPEDDLPWNE